MTVFRKSSLLGFMPYVRWRSKEACCLQTDIQARRPRPLGRRPIGVSQFAAFAVAQIAVSAVCVCGMDVVGEIQEARRVP